MSRFRLGSPLLVLITALSALGCSGSPSAGGDGDSSGDGDGDSVGDGDGVTLGDGDIDLGMGGGQGSDPCEGSDPPATCDQQFEPAGPGCGDGEVNVAGEQCDDANGLPGDACDGACEVEPNWDCTSGICIPNVNCPDGVVDGAEVCDDGNSVSGDGCSDQCTQIDPFFLCPFEGGACVSTVACGDKRISGNEQCEDAATVGTAQSGDGCSDTCTLETGWYCPTIGQPCKKVPYCGDGLQSGSEECDDKSLGADDGCDDFCKVQTGFACPTPGQLCVEIVVECGDGSITGTEQCDDGNKTAGDGCSKTCVVEGGFTCSTAGILCTPKCGDGLVRGQEACDDGALANNDGCSSKCTWEKGWACAANPPHNCTADTCGNSKVGNGESCDDGNKTPGDGCSPACTAEPACTTYGANGCTSACGDGLVISEACDDGNKKSGDGCSSTCEIEEGFDCTQAAACAEKLAWDHDNNNSTAAIQTCVARIPIIYRDFDAAHDHFEPGWDSSGTKNLVVSSLDANGKPDWSSTSDGVITAGTASQFDYWYRDSAASTTVVDELVLWDRDRVATDAAYAASNNAAGLSFVNRWGPQGEKWFVMSGGSGPRYEWCSNTASDGCTGKGNCADNKWTTCHAPCTPWGNNQACAQYPAVTAGTRTEWDGSPVFFPIDGRGKTPNNQYSTAAIAPQYGGNWDAESNYTAGAGTHNFHFTSEVRRWFKYDSSRTYKLEFTGDDDVWVFINGKLAVDLGGWHVPQDGGVTISNANAGTYSLVNGRVYEIVVFQAERKVTGSSYRLTLSGFNSNASVCTATCGDSIVASTEQCDDGTNSGGYGKCQPGCLLGPRCGDNSKTNAEECDNGSNLSGYNDPSGGACSPGCLTPSRCGDDVVDFGFGEVCDNGGANSSAYGACGTDCQLGPRCGDGAKSNGEECDDGVNDGTAGCGPGCVNTSACGNGFVDPGEQCDDGVNDGGYNECSPSCLNGPRCGDGQTQSAFEQCDDGTNSGAYGKCSPICRLGPYCGDGVKNGAEGCDDGVNEGGYGKCGPTCKPSEYCGDGKVQGPREQCDDKNRSSGDGCSSSCLTEMIEE